MSYNSYGNKSFRVNYSSRPKEDNIMYNYIIPRLRSQIALDVGDYKISARNQDFNGWLICDGRSLSRTAYNDLFEVIGTSFGSIDSNSFNLPDYKGRVIGGIGLGTGLTTRNLGDSVGTETHTLSVTEIPSHNHTGTTNSSGEHIHGITDPSHTHTGTTNSDGTHTHSITDPTHNHSYVHYNDEVSGGTHGTPTGDDTGNLVGDTTGSSGTGITVNSGGAHTHTFTSNSSSTGISVNSNGAHTHTFTTDNTGGSQSHNNMQPTLFGGNVFIFSKFLPFRELQGVRAGDIYDKF